MTQSPQSITELVTHLLEEPLKSLMSPRTSFKVLALFFAKPSAKR